MTKIIPSSNISRRFLIQMAVGGLALLMMIIPAVSEAATLTRQLDIGDTGSDVSVLQTFLAQDPSIYPQGLVTGYYGTLTAAAVSNFQTKNGLEAVGRVGPLTLALINSQMSVGMVSTTGGAPSISGVSINVSNMSATINWNTNEYAKGLVYYSSSPLTTYEHTNSVDVSGNTAMTDSNLRTSQSVLVTGLQPNTTYYYLIYTTDQSGNVSVTWPATFQTTS